MNDLDTLRPEVREALHRINRNFHISADYETIRAELLRLTADRRRADVIRDSYMTQLTQTQLERGDAIQRAEKAESELATAQNTINAQQDTMGALKRKLALSEGELAALKARIADGWLCGVSNDACPGNFDAAIYCLPSRFRGKRVRLVVEE